MNQTAVRQSLQLLLYQIRHVVFLLGSLSVHCGNVLLNGKSVWRRLLSIALGAFPTILWTVCFKQAKRIPNELRPAIHIDLLPKWHSALLTPVGIFVLTLIALPLARLVSVETKKDEESSERSRGKSYFISIILFPIILLILDHLSHATISPRLDLLAFASYGALHFASPILMAWWLWFFASQGSASTFGWCLGWQNLLGLITHLVWPNAAPWFYDVYGTNAAEPDYNYPGNPAGLVRVDAILGTHIYTHAFGKSPVVFGAIPSLHAATCICCGLFVTRYGRGYLGLGFMWIYCAWMLWSTMYLHHHYAIDLLMGTIYAATSFFIATRLRLRRLDQIFAERGLTNGWERLWGGLHDGEKEESSRRRSTSETIELGLGRGHGVEYVRVPIGEDGESVMVEGV